MSQPWRPQPVARRRPAAHLSAMNVQSTIQTPAAGARTLGPRAYRGVNWVGLATLYQREVRRFWKVGLQTVAAPVVTTLLYMMIFTVAVNGQSPTLEGVPFAAFVGPGLIMMGILNNAFGNSSSSLIQAKLMGTSPEFLTPPLSPLELTIGFALGAATRGMLVGLVTAVAVWPFSRFGFSHLWAVLYFSTGASLIMAFIGVAGGLWSEKFDHLAAVTNFLVLPMTFLSGTFYLVERLPEPFRTASAFNPFFYLIDGFRYGFIGKAEGSVAVGAAVTAVLTAALAVWCWDLFRRGWRLKS
jgi:ABC-2 type transport system permease protein